MKSKLASQAKAALLVAAQKLTPEERLNAFLQHCRLMMELQRGGRDLEASARRARS
jgi:hypothetical protein